MGKKTSVLSVECGEDGCGQWIDYDYVPPLKRIAKDLKRHLRKVHRG